MTFMTEPMKLESPKGNRKSWYSILAVAAGLILLYFFTIDYSRSHFTCLYCRLSRKVEKYASFTFETIAQNECARWYAASFPPHEHEWMHSHCTYSRQGCTTILALSSDPPVRLIPGKIQQAFLSNSTENQRQTFFRLLRSENQAEVDQALQMAWGKSEE